MIESYAFGSSIPMSKAVYAGLEYVVGPLAPYLCVFIVIGFITSFYWFGKFCDMLWLKWFGEKTVS